MKYWVIIIVFLVGMGVGYFVPHDDSCVWNLWDDPRGCVIAWDDGTYSCKSRTIEIGTLQPGESREVMINNMKYPGPDYSIAEVEDCEFSIPSVKDW